MKVVTLAIMQNMWFEHPDIARRMFERNADRRHDLIRRFLFAGCLSGRRLRDAFGYACDEIVWEEASRNIGGASRSVFPPDVAHITDAIIDHTPDIIITFGRVAESGLQQAIDTGMVAMRPTIKAPHPAARGENVVASLTIAARELQNLTERIRNGTQDPPICTH